MSLIDELDEEEISSHKADKQQMTIDELLKDDLKTSKKEGSKRKTKVDLVAELENSKSDAELAEDIIETDNIFKDDEGNLVKNIEKILHDSMIPYSECVIMDRALPRVEDGLKPVQRRILYTMYLLGLTPDKPYRKSAKIVGDVLGKFHPHGDSSVYDAMVRLAQNFSLREVLVDGHGNFGSVDGDGAAAYRYTEARMAPLALELLKDIEKDTVNWSKNYDDTEDEPNTLPGRFPNLLVNGAEGIAIGMATHIPPHNLGECIDACDALVDNENLTTDDLMKYIKGPDFPTGGIILGTEELKQAYETGKGKITIRAKTFIETDKNGKQTIVISEFPYQVNKALQLKRIGELKEKNKDLLSGISEIRDESDRNGIRAVVVLKKDAPAEKILNYILKNTELQTTYGMNLVAIADGKPKQMGIKEILMYYINYQRDIVLRRSKFDLEVAKERAHILEGLLIAIKNIDEVIKIIKKSSGTVEAKAKLREKFALSEKQVQAILDMRLARLTNLEVTKIEDELVEQHKTIEKLTAIIGSKKLQMNVVKQEMNAIKKNFATKRVTQIPNNDKAFEITEDVELKPIKDVYVCYSERGTIKKIFEKGFNVSSRSVSQNSSLNEVHSIILKTKTDRSIIMFSNYGNCYKVNLDEILEARWKDRGTLIADLHLGFSKDEKILSMFDYNKLPNKELLFVTKSGVIRKSSWSEFENKKPSFVAYKLNDGDKLVAVEEFEKGKTMLFVTKDAITLNANIDDVPTQSKNSLGVKGMNMQDKDEVVFAGLVNNEDNVLIVTDLAFAKKVPVADISVLARNRKGVKITNLSKDNGTKIMFADVSKSQYEIFCLDNKNKVVWTNQENVAVENRTTKGKTFASNKKGAKLTCALKYLWNAD